MSTHIIISKTTQACYLFISQSLIYMFPSMCLGVGEFIHPQHLTVLSAETLKVMASATN